jgi:hypothetical protein
LKGGLCRPRKACSRKLFSIDLTDREFVMKRDTQERDGCRLVTLARNNVAHVQRCTHCGALAVHLGPVTLRFDEGALESVWNIMGQALAQSREENEPHSVPTYARAGQA